MRTDFRRMIAERNFEPGEILVNFPLEDRSSNTISAAQVRREESLIPKERVEEMARSLARAAGYDYDNIPQMRADGGPEVGTQASFLQRAKNALADVGGRATNTRSRIYERMGFSRLTDRTSGQFAQVVQDQNGRLTIRPI